MLPNRFAIPFIVLAAALLLAGCGQKGPLYLPEKKASSAETPAGTPSLAAVFSRAEKR